MASLGSTQEGRNTLSQIFRTCNPMESNADTQNLLSWIENGLVDMAMLDYPYKTNYGVEFPAWPVNTTCSIILSFPPQQVVQSMAAGFFFFFYFFFF